jgi:hypothetical protein
MFYSVKGTIKDFDTVELTVEDIHPMDKGTAGSTGYDLDEDFIEWRMDNPHTLPWKLGMIHSHHSMKSYFSATDLSELDDNTEFHNYYLSLVVNNRGEMVAKVAFRGNINGYGCKDERGEDWSLKLSNARQVMFTFDCDIQSPKTSIKVPKNFKERTAEIIKTADTHATTYYKKGKEFQNKFPNNYKNNHPGYYNKNQKHLPPYKKKSQNPFDVESFESIEDEVDDMEAKMWNDSFSREPIKGKTDMDTEERYIDFTRYLLRLADDTEIIGDTLEDALEESDHVEDKSAYLNSIITMYPAIFEKYWDIFGEIDTERFITITGETLDVLDNYQGLFDIVEPVTQALEMMVSKMDV